uniref:Metallo-beta-lactamase domain-containing protein n=1 Tax=Timema cristinae TaxID=61476 RepID=A0A7R9D1G4_TIMCR|nr:unnamed protein product [Timema cristinae]
MDEKRILVDAGDMNVPEYINSLKSVLQEENVELEHIIVTHWHQDHIGGVKNVIENTENGKSCSVWKFKDDISASKCLPVNITLKWLKNEDKIVTQGATLRVVHTPGHTTDHIVLCLVEEQAIFSGDCILGEGTAVFENLYDYMNSLNIILQLNPDIIYPGHGPVVESPVTKIQYYIDHRNKREGQILQVLKEKTFQKLTEREIVKIIYKETPKELHAAAAVNVNHHLNKLLREHKVLLRDGTHWQYRNIESSL